jgi:L-fuconolactonase
MPADSIDAPRHLRKHSAEDSPRMPSGMEGIRRDFLIADLKPALYERTIAGAVNVQARQNLAETDRLTDLASVNDLAREGVEAVPVVDLSVGRGLDRLALHDTLKSVGHVVRDAPDDFYMSREDFIRRVRLPKQFNFGHDILIFDRHLPQAVEFVNRHPGHFRGRPYHQAAPQGP